MNHKPENSFSSAMTLAFFCILLLQTVQSAAIAGDLPLPQRCHLVAPCSKRLGCEPDLDSKELFVKGRTPVQLGVACVSSTGSRMYGTGGFFSYTIWEEGSNKIFSTGKFNLYDMSLKAHVSGEMELPMGIFTISVMEGQLQNKRKSIADGKPYRVHANLFSPSEPAFMITPDPQYESNETTAPSQSQIQYGNYEPLDSLASVEDIMSGGSASESENGINVGIIIIVIIVSVLSFTVLLVGITLYLRSREASCTESVPEPRQSKLHDIKAAVTYDPETGNAEKDFVDKIPVEDRMNPGLGYESDHQAMILPAMVGTEAAASEKIPPSISQRRLPASNEKKMVTIDGPMGREGLRVSAFTANLLEKRLVLPGMFPSSTSGVATQRINWATTPTDENFVINHRLAPLAMDVGTDESFMRRYHEVLHSHGSYSDANIDPSS